MSNTFGNCENGSAAAPTMVATIRIRVRLLRCLPRIWLAIHSSTSVSTPAALAGAQLSIAVSGDSATVRDGPGQQIVETSVIAALCGGVVDLKQRLGLRAADRLVLDRGRGQDAGAPSGVIGVQFAGEMNATFGGRAFAGNHAIAHDSEGKCCGIAAGDLGWFEGGDTFGRHSGGGRHWYSLLFFQTPAIHAGRERVVNDSKLASRLF